MDLQIIVWACVIAGILWTFLCTQGVISIKTPQKGQRDMTRAQSEAQNLIEEEKLMEI